VYRKIIDTFEQYLDHTANVIAGLPLYYERSLQMIDIYGMSDISKKITGLLIPRHTESIRSTEKKMRWSQIEPLIQEIMVRTKQTPQLAFKFLLDIELRLSRNTLFRPTVQSPWNPQTQFPDADRIIKDLVTSATRNDTSLTKWQDWLAYENSLLTKKEAESLSGCGVVSLRDGTYRKTTGRWTNALNGTKAVNPSPSVLAEEALVRSYTHEIGSLALAGIEISNMMKAVIIVRGIMLNEGTKQLTTTPLADISAEIIEKLEARIVPQLRMAKEHALHIEDLIDEHRSKFLSVDDKKDIVRVLDALFKKLQAREHQLWQIMANVQRMRSIVVNDRLRTINDLMLHRPLTVTAIERAQLLCDSIISAFNTEVTSDSSSPRAQLFKNTQAIKMVLTDLADNENKKNVHAQYLKDRTEQLQKEYDHAVIPMLQELELACSAHSTDTFTKIKDNISAVRNRPLFRTPYKHPLYIQSIVHHLEKVQKIPHSVTFVSAHAFFEEWLDILQNYVFEQTRARIYSEDSDRMITELQRIVKRSYLSVPRKISTSSTRKAARRVP
jgi:hypothetical protein